MVTEAKNSIVEESKALEIALLLFMLNKIESTLGNDSASARAIAINEIRKYSSKNTSSFLKNADKGIVKSLTDDNNKVLDELLEKGGKPIPLISSNNKHVKDSVDYFKKYIKTDNMRIDNQKLTQYYTNFINSHVKDIVDGNTTIEEATKKAVKELSESGIKIIEYNSGVKRNIDVVVRQQMEYASKQSTKDTREAFAKDNGITIWEFDAHANARPSHQTWQGKRYDITGKEYPTLNDLTHGEQEDYGCKHTAFPVWNKDDKYMLTQNELDNIDTKPFEWHGKEYDGYAATQKARSMERDIRALKREKALTKVEDAKLNTKLSKKNKEYRDFMKTFGTYPRTNRTSDYIKPKTHITDLDKKSIPNHKSSKKETSKKEVTKNKMGRNELVLNARDIFVKKNSDLGINEANRRFDLLVDGNSNTYLKKYINKNRL